MTIGRSTRDEESPLLYAELARERVYRTPFPWSQLSILFALQIARYMPSYVSRTIIPDVRYCCFEICSPRTLLSVNSKSWDSKRREECWVLCRVTGTCRGPSKSGVSELDKNNRYPRYTLLKQSQYSISPGCPIK